MKHSSSIILSVVSLLTASTMLFCGCETTPQDLGEDVGTHLKRGITGQGKVQEYDRDLPDPSSE